jgi:hypothetical protein
MFAARFVCSWIGAFGLAAGAFCQTYVPFSVDGGAFPSSINEKGEIAGAYSDFVGNLHGFVRDAAGTITPFDVPNSNRAQANSINAAGVITGSYSTPQARGFVRHPRVKSPRSIRPEALQRTLKGSMPEVRSPAYTPTRMA